ncbi:MAG: 50S ribosomal protein L15 [Alphaproteobacteria bacterium]
MKLNELTDLPGARKGSKRIGRGIGSGKGTTAGRGDKGQKSRSGIALQGFEGGQMPLYRRLPKRGFTPPRTRTYQVLNLDKLQTAIDNGRLDASQPITEAHLLEAGVVRRRRDGIRLLGRGELKAKLEIHVTGASKSAVEAVEKAGGSVTVAAAAKEEGASS